MARPAALLGTAAVLLAGSFITSGTASAAEADCKATGITPAKVNRGVKETITTTITLKTDCPADAGKVEWHGNIDWPAGVTRIETNWYAMFTTYQGDSPKYNHSDTGLVNLPTASPKNDLAGIPMPIAVQAFVDTNGNDKKDSDEPTFSYKSTITQFRQTRIKTFSADRTEVKKGAVVTFTAAAERANWDTRTWDSFRGAGFLDLQFSNDGGQTWTKVAEGGSAAAPRHAVTETGDYRVRFKGDLHSGASASAAVHVTVS